MLIAAIDQGTTSTRCILFNREGAVASCQMEHRQILAQPGWVEHDPLEIWSNTQKCIAGALEKAGVTGRQIEAVGVTNQRETTVVWDPETGEPFCSAIVWQDTRTQEICERLAAVGGSEQFRRVTGLPLATYFSGPKLQWILENVPGVKAAAERGEALFGTMDSYLIWWLTGGPAGGSHVTDVTNASRTMLMGLKSLAWEEELLDVFGVPREMLGRITASSDAIAFGTTLRAGPFGAAIPITGNLGDQQAALVGHLCLEPGDVKNTYGTGCFLLLNTGEQIVQSTHGLISTVAYQRAGQAARYALEGSVAVAGAVVQWLRDQLGIIAQASEIEALAGSVADNGGVYFVPAFSGLFAPHWRADARGTICGLTRFATKGHLARAALEAVALQTAEVLAAMRKDAQVELPTLRVDGGMTGNRLLMQIQADVLGIGVEKSGIAEMTALGAAYAAGLATGMWKDAGELRSLARERELFSPRIAEAARTNLLNHWERAVQKSIGWL